MNKNGIPGIAVLLLASCAPAAVHAQTSQVAPDATQVAPEFDPAISYGEFVDSPEYVTSQSAHGGSRLSRWWHERAKPHLQYSHWGYPEYFVETPVGASLRATQHTQIYNGWCAQMMLYQYDFCDGAASLNLHGQKRLNDIISARVMNMHDCLRIEATPGSPELDQARRDFVAKTLAEAGVPPHVGISYPVQVSPFGDETRLVNENLLQRVLSGKPIRGSAGGSISGASSGSSGSSGESE